ncbi:MAG TPA: cation:proton antiporter [Candidatus Paceibacterota bacterium]|nr:cation:proton antiporter [Verrucomicrobiota bacterium]HSA12211.1 cation:proton antiporter [Candidatus Paceibacterota bacterium]
MHSVAFLQDLAVVMIVAGLVTLIFHRFKQPVVLGYILAGVIIGPHTPPAALIHDKQTIDTLAELGVILLMFSLGLEFNLRKLTQVGASALIAALMEILLLFWVGYEIGRYFAWPLLDRIFLGAMLSMSSTTVIIKVLGELGKMKERFSQLIFGVLIIEDILGIAMIALLSGIAMTGRLSVGDVGLTLGKLGIFLAVALVVGLIAVPRLLGYVARFKSNEMLIITVLGLCFGVSLLAAKLGYSVALGAFIIGAVIAEAREIHRVETLLEPVRDMFSAIFFVAIGLLIEPAMLIAHWQPVLVITLAVIVGKVLTCSFGAFVGGNDTRTSLRVGMGLAQIGEFSFIIASLGVTLKVTSNFLYPIAVAVSAITTLLTPYLIKSADTMVGWFDRVAPRPLVSSLDLYTRWVGQFGSQRDSSMASKLVRQWLWQMALNSVLVAGVFIAAAFLERRRPGWLKELGIGDEGLKAAFWLAAVVFSLPLLIATFRKLQALGLLIAETKVHAATAGERTAAIRAVVAQVVPIAGTVVMGIFVLALSSTLLPSMEVFAVLVLIVAIVTWLLWRSSIRIYSKAQAALVETFAQPPAPRQSNAPAALPSLLREADLETVTLAANSAAAGKLIGELELRTRTGASIVGIERSGSRIINPGPDEELQSGDQILLLGARSQLDSARTVLTTQV